MHTTVSVERRKRAIAADGAVAPARSRRLESNRAAPVPAAAATLPSKLRLTATRKAWMGL
eukprot:scaffold100119_cov75-Phaeocystis_antarctica.AAC.1